MLVTAEDLQRRVGELGREISADYGEDPDRPLYSNRADQRQDKPHDKEKPADPEPNGEPDEDEINRLLAQAKSVFPNSKQIE